MVVERELDGSSAAYVFVHAKGRSRKLDHILWLFEPLTWCHAILKWAAFIIIAFTLPVEG
jgi:hypothetical protein